MFVLRDFFRFLFNRAHQAQSRNSKSIFLDPASFDKEAVIEKIIEQGKSWRVHYQGTWWTARCIKQVMLFPGDTVYVIGRHSITLLIEPTSLNRSTPSEAVLTR